jgi:hypothetical protein
MYGQIDAYWHVCQMVSRVEVRQASLNRTSHLSAQLPDRIVRI